MTKAKTINNGRQTPHPILNLHRIVWSANWRPPNENNIRSAWNTLTSNSNLLGLFNTVHIWTLRDSDIWQSRNYSFSAESAKLVNISSKNNSDSYRMQLVHRLGGHEGAVLYCAVDPKEKILATCSDDGKINLWTIATGQILRTLSGGHTGEITSCAFCSIGPILASSSRDKKVILWHHGTGKRASRLGKSF